MLLTISWPKWNPSGGGTAFPIWKYVSQYRAYVISKNEYLWVNWSAFSAELEMVWNGLRPGHFSRRQQSVGSVVQCGPLKRCYFVTPCSWTKELLDQPVGPLGSRWSWWRQKRLLLKFVGKNCPNHYSWQQCVLNWREGGCFWISVWASHSCMLSPRDRGTRLPPPSADNIPWNANNCLVSKIRIELE